MCLLSCSYEYVPELENHQICIRSDAALHQQVYNAPLASQVAAMWAEENVFGEHVSHHIIGFSHSGVVIDAKTTKLFCVNR